MIRPIRVVLIITAGLMIAGCSASENETSGGEAVSTSPDVVATGDFVSKGDQQISGSYRIENVGDYRRLLFTDDFSTSDGPDLHVVLSPTPVNEAGDDNAVVEGAAVLDTLSALQGKQVYYLPDTLDVNTFQSVLIHCIEFSHLYGAAPVE